MAHPASRSSVRSTVLSATLLLACSAPAMAATTPPSPAGRQAPAAEPDLLKVLPASHDELLFRGENSGATWPVFFSRSEATRTAVLQLGLLNTVSLLPERSTIRVSINGRVLANMQARSPEKVTAIPVRIPPGVLVPGFNAVQISVAMAHRVDCSVKATYELWTLLDPAQTGFLVPAQAAAPVRTLDDLAAEPPAEDGTTRIHLRVPADPDADLLGRGAEAIAALVARSHLIRPVVDVGPEPGKGPGFDLILGTDPGSDAAAGQNRVTLRRDAESRRMVIAVADPTDGSVINGADGSRALGTPQGLRSFETLSGLAVDTERRLTFSELGLRSESTAGRHYVGSLGVTLPDDFYPGSYGKALMYLDATHAPGLSASASLVFRVNGTLVSSLSMGPNSPERFDHEQVELPLQFFRPGYNEIQIEGLMPTASDEQCDLTAAPTGPRLSVVDTSELVMPRFARLRTTPQIMSTIRFDRSASAEPLDLYLTDGDPHLVGAGLTVVANMAARDRTAGRVRVRLDQPSRSDNSGIVIGPMSTLPELLANPLHGLTEAASDAAAPPADAGGDAAPRPATDADAVGGDIAPMQSVPTAAGRRTLRDSLTAAYAAGQQWLRNKGFFYAQAQGEGPRLHVSEGSLLVADVLADDGKPAVAGIDLPRFVTAPKSWVVVTGSTDAGIADDLGALVANSHWKDLNGQATVYDPASGQLQSMQPRTITYVIPKSIPVGDLRPILGGLMSSNIAASTLVLLVLLSLLGMTTHVLLRFVGERQK